MFGALLQILTIIYLLPLAGAVYSRMVPYPSVDLVNLDSSLREERSWHLSVALCVWLPARTPSQSRGVVKDFL